MRYILKIGMIFQLFIVGTVTSQTINNSDTEYILGQFRQQLSYEREYKLICQMATFLPDKKTAIHKYKLFNKEDKILLSSLEPARDRGKKILMIGDELWQYFPKIRKTMVINAAATLSGGVNLTDIISSSLFQFYGFSKHEFLENDQTHILTFTALSKSSPYGKVIYYFRDSRIQYFEAYARSGILLKKIYFVEYTNDGKNGFFPVRLKIVNALQEGDYSLIQMSSFENVQIPDYFFNASALDKVPDE